MRSVELVKTAPGSLTINQRLQKFGLNPSVIIFFVLIGLSPLFLPNQYIIRLLISALMVGALAMAFDFTNGYINICNFGFAAFWGCGAYASGLLVGYLDISPLIGMLFASLVTAFLGLLIGLLSIRLGGIFASCMTWFVSLALMTVANNLVDITNGSSGLRTQFLFFTPSNTPYFYIMLVATFLVYLILMKLVNSDMGLAFKVIGKDIDAASSSGINPVKYKIINFTISCAIAGFIGAIYAHYIGIITPTIMSTDKTVEVMAIAYIGGRGSIWGALICALLLIPLMDIAKGLLEWRMIIYGSLMIAVMIYYPQGLKGLLEQLWKVICRIAARVKGGEKL